MSKCQHNIIYKIVNTINFKIYIGCHQTNTLEDGYMGSGTVLQKAFKKYSIENFEKIVLFNFDSVDEMFNKEAELVNEAFVKRPDTYNVCLGGNRDMGWKTKGLVLVENLDGSHRTMMSKDDLRYETEYFPFIKDKRFVKDKFGKGSLVSKDDPRYLSGELVFIWKDRKLTKEHREKISKANKISQQGKRNSQYGTIWINRNGIIKKIKREELDLYVKSGWTRGRKIN